MVDFMYIGPSRAGSTWMYGHLNQHPTIKIPGGKLSHYWDEHYRGGKIRGRPYAKRPVESWLSMFKSRKGSVIGDFTESYSPIDLEIIQEIYKWAPNVKILYSLRNPLDIAWSSCKYVVPRKYRYKYEDTPSDDMISFINGEWTLNSTKGYDYKNCDPIGTIKKWASVFPMEQIKAYWFDDVRKQPKQLMVEISEFLGIDPLFWDEYGDSKFRRRELTSQKYEIREEVKQAIKDAHWDKIAEVEKMFDADLSHWREKWL